MVDDLSSVNKSNAEYRTLIVENDHKVNLIQKELIQTKRTVALKDKLISAVEEEKKAIKKQFNKLVEEMRAASESESAHEVDLKVELAVTKQEVDMLTHKVKTTGASWKLELEEALQNLETM